jgi:predicted GNAT superfamily acetyltransferase
MLGSVTQATTALAVTVRDVSGAHELRACQELQRRAWGITEDGYVVPVATMASVQRVGGLILGAFDAQEMLIGFAFAFLGKLNGRLILWSQLTGVHPAHQSTGVGRMLKLEQRKRARDMGLEAVAWAFDPLQASNAAFNLAVLGATCRTYVLDMYGSRSDALNVGLATDRLLAEWSTTSDPGGKSESSPDTIELIDTSSGQPRSSGQLLENATHLSIQVPARIADLKSRGSPDILRGWQLALREAFQASFDAGYAAVGFSRVDPAAPRYLLERPG